MRERPSLAVGIDVGGTKIAGAVVDVSGGEILTRRTLATAAERGPEAVLGDAIGLARSLIEGARGRGREVLGIGCGVPELVDLDGNVRSSYNFAWTGLAVQARFAELGPAVVESDVRAAACAEAAFGAARGARHAIYVTVGSGISYSLVIDGEPYAGANGYAIHFANSPLTARCDSCGPFRRRWSRSSPRGRVWRRASPRWAVSRALAAGSSPPRRRTIRLRKRW